MPDEFTDRSRAERAFTDLFADRAAGEDFPPLDPTSLMKPARRGWPGWLGPVAAVAAVAVVVAIALPLWHGRPVPASPAAPTGPGAWQLTAPIPIGQRYGAVSLWAQDAFYLLGGNAHCGLDDQGNPRPEGSCRASLPSRGELRADGARYDPATDSWTKLADAPVGIGAGQGVLAGDAIYLMTEPLAEEAPLVLRYDLAADSWSELPQPADQRKVRQLLSWGGQLYAATVPADCAEYECAEIVHAWDATANSWTEYASGNPALYYSGGATALASTGDGFVTLTDTGAAAFTAGSWRDLPDVPFQYPAAAYTVGDIVVAISDAGQAYSLDLTNPVWLRRQPPTTGDGGLLGADSVTSSTRFFDGKHVVIRGQLLDPVADAWTDVPTLPNPEWSFGSFAGNGGQLLACYVGPPDSLNDCYVLDLGEPTATEPPPAAVDEWVEVASSPLEPRTQAITVWIGDEFLVVGGQHCDGGSAEPYPDGGVGCSARTTEAREGAAYDPATDRWRTIAMSPVDLAAADSVAVIGQTLYAISGGTEGLWAYDAAADTWRELPSPPGGTHGGASATDLLATGEVLLALGESHQSDAWYDPTTGAWTELPPGTYPNDVYASEARRTVAFTGKELLIAEPGLSEDTFDTLLNWSVYDLDDDGRLATVPAKLALPATQGFGSPVVNRAATTVLIPSPDGGAAVYRAGGAAEWVTVPEPEAVAGPLVPGLVLGDQVSLHGNLFNPQTGTWRYPAALPDGPGPGAVQAAGPDAVLSCFTLTASNELGSRCYLLRP